MADLQNEIKNDKRVTISKLLKHFEIELAEQGFMRANHYTIVNTKYIIDFQGGLNHTITLTNDEKIRISRRKTHLFRNLFNN
ncbi:MAG: LytTR family DNA-binding domain-containing protein [Bacteroidales bacterium]|nr:LytTR family DNA-binding domain-containing protein [Bacteroidales bacterium]